MLSLDLSTLKEAGMAVALGLMMGLERERSGFERSQESREEPSHRRESDQVEGMRGSLGARTFALLTLLGWISVKVGGTGMALPIAVQAFAALLIGLFYFETSTSERGLTTEVAAMGAAGRRPPLPIAGPNRGLLLPGVPPGRGRNRQGATPGAIPRRTPRQ